MGRHSIRPRSCVILRADPRLRSTTTILIMPTRCQGAAVISRPRLLAMLWMTWITWLALWLTACSPSAPSSSKADPTSKAQVQQGQTIYAQHCAHCHGAALEGQPAWQSRKADGKLPAPPHDGSGHTWHHDDKTLFDIIQNGLEKYAGPNYPTDMPRFAGILSPDQTWAVLAYIQSTWPADIAQHQRSLNR